MNNPPPSAALRQARKVVVAVAGVSCILVGVVLLFIPGPGTVAILAGLGLLATEFVWARRWLRLAKARAQRAAGAATSSQAPRAPAQGSPEDPHPDDGDETSP